MIPYHTIIDTIAFQINCNRDSLMQREILHDYKEYLQRIFKSYVDSVEYSTGFDTRIEHKVYCNNRTVLSIQTGYSNHNFYVKIIVAGLYTYDKVVDKTSEEYLWTTVAYLKSNHLKFSMAELDIAIDIPHVNFG